jgi:predicted RNA-binding protein with PUA-like domain
MKKSTVRNPAERYWLFKSEPSVFSIDHLAKAPKQTSHWDGVRNYQARNFLRDDVKVGDQVLFYNSSDEPLGIAGTMTVVQAGIPDETAFNPKSCYYDPKSDPTNPRWFVVDVKFLQKFPEIVTRQMLAEDPVTSQMLVMKRGMRLSIQPVTKEEWQAVHKLASVKV